LFLAAIFAGLEVLVNEGQCRLAKSAYERWYIEVNKAS
jgi:hypothetical protein